MFRAGWIDDVADLHNEETLLQFHYTARGKERFRTMYEMIRELGNDSELMSASERSELLAIVEACIRDVEEQKDLAGVPPPRSGNRPAHSLAAAAGIFCRVPFSYGCG